MGIPSSYIMLLNIPDQSQLQPLKISFITQKLFIYATGKHNIKHKYLFLCSPSYIGSSIKAVRKE